MQNKTQDLMGFITRTYDKLQGPADDLTQLRWDVRQEVTAKVLSSRTRKGRYESQYNEVSIELKLAVKLAVSPGC